MGEAKIKESKGEGLDVIVAEVLKEMNKAKAKFPEWPTDPIHAVTILGEEYGELQKAVLQLTYEPEKQDFSDGNMREEAIQVAAMALRFLMSFGEYEFALSKQHKQL